MYFIITIATIGFLYYALCMILYIKQEDFIFKSKKVHVDAKLGFTSNHREQFYPTSDNGKIHTVLFKGGHISHRVVFYLHGARGHHEHWEDIAEHFSRYDWDVLMIDYRGYGKSRGKRTPSNLLQDVIEIYDKQVEQYGESNIIVYGRSLGSVFATALSAGRNPKMMILETPILSILEQAKHKFGYLPIPLKILLKYTYDNHKYIQKIKCPVHVFHGSDDEVVPLNDVEMLLKGITEYNMTVIQDGNHYNLHQYPSYHGNLKNLLT